MLKEYEKYHGVVLRALVAKSREPISIGVDDLHGRINGYVVNSLIGLYIKHSSKRLTPWSFTFNDEHLSELEYLNGKYKVFVVFVCGIDGIACIPYQRVLEIGQPTSTGQLYIGIARSRSEMYGVYGAKQSLSRKVAVGVREILDEL
ncbi:MAG: hypothetical protein WD715_06905 [Dongiaceae bacterium]